MWYLLFPDVGLAIELAHGVGVSWDGRVHRHCTAVPRHVAPRDHLYALFLGQYTRVVNASERVAELRCAPRSRRAAGSVGPSWALAAWCGPSFMPVAAGT